MSSRLLPVSKSKLYLPQLDSVRGISFIAIFLFHAVRITDKPFFLSGFVHFLYSNLDMGIEIFFVLSSFLLTWLGLREYEKRGNFSFKNYFVRRALRIWPLYFFILFLGFVIIPAVANHVHHPISLPDKWYYIFFIANFYTIDHVFFLRILWTISVEEQFYLFWGLSLKFFHKRLLWVIAILVLTSISFEVYAMSMHAPSYFNTLTYLFDFACGASAAVLVSRPNRISDFIRKLSQPATIIFYCYLVFHFIIFYFLNKNSTGIINDLVALINRYLFIIYIAIFIAEQVINNSRTKFFAESKFLIFTGKLSYGLYCYHGMTITVTNIILNRFQISNWIIVIICFAITYMIATISYFYLETPFLKLKTKLRRI